MVAVIVSPLEKYILHAVLTYSLKGLMLEVPHELNYIVMQLWPKLAKSEATALVALVPPSDLNLDPKPVSPVSEGGILGFSSARRSWHYHYLDQVCCSCIVWLACMHTLCG